LGDVHLLLSDVLEDHVDVDVEPAEGADELLVSLHDHPNLGSDAPVDQLCSTQPVRTSARGHAHENKRQARESRTRTQEHRELTTEPGGSKKFLRDKSDAFSAYLRGGAGRDCS
jgi:hypothetical protein